MQRDDALMRALLLVLTSTPRADAVARAVATGTLRSLAPHALTIHAACDDALELRSQFGLPHAARRLCERIPCDVPAPEAEVFRTGVALDLLAHDLPQQFALVAHHDTDRPDRVLVHPLLHTARPIGVVTLRLSEQTAIDATAQALLEATMAAIALWVLVDAQSAPAPTGAARLQISDRQRRIIDGMRRGLTNSAIAVELGFALGTIKADITTMSALLGAAGREDLLRKASRAGI